MRACHAIKRLPGLRPLLHPGSQRRFSSMDARSDQLTDLPRTLKIKNGTKVSPSVLIKPILKFSIFELKPLFISCEFNIPGIFTFYAFLWQLKKITVTVLAFVQPSPHGRSTRKLEKGQVSASQFYRVLSLTSLRK